MRGLVVLQPTGCAIIVLERSHSKNYDLDRWDPDEREHWVLSPCMHNVFSLQARRTPARIAIDCIPRRGCGVVITPDAARGSSGKERPI